MRIKNIHVVVSAFCAVAGVLIAAIQTFGSSDTVPVEVKVELSGADAAARDTPPAAVNGDGKTDCREIRDGDGRLLERWLDQNFDSRWDVHERYAGGLPTVNERDCDFDGSYDRRGEFRLGVLTEETITPGGAGNPLFRLDYRHGVLSAVWSDPERDGRWNERADYDPMGRESARVPMQ